MIGAETFSNRRRRIPRAFLVSAAILLSCCKHENLVDSFSFKVLWVDGPITRLHPESILRPYGIRTLNHPLFLSDSPEIDSDDEKESWSRRASSSPLKVRNRVRAVLKRARNRTGIRNSSEEESGLPFTNEPSEPVVLADAESNVITLREANTNDDSFPIKKNGSADYANGSLLQYLKTSVVPEVVEVPGFYSPTTMNISLSDKKRTTKPESSGKETISKSGLAVVEPLPFTLPKLTDEQRRLLVQGERIQEQSKMGNEGSGYVVVDVKAPAYVVWECLLDFESYPETIPTVRDMKLFTSTHLQHGFHAEKPVLPGTGREARHYGKASVTRAAFVLSKFRFNIAAIHTYQPHPDGHYMIFTLDPSCTNVVLQSAKGIWYTEESPEGREDYTRVWLLCELKVSWALPTFIVDYAAKRAMPRATTWLKPQVEAAAELWLKERPNGQT